MQSNTSLPNDRIASCSYDATIKIWKSDSPYSDTPIKVLRDHSKVVFSLLYIKERYIMISGSIDSQLRNMSTYQCDKVINDCYINKGLYQIDRERIMTVMGGDLIIINIDKGIKEKTIEIERGYGIVNCLLKLNDNKTILCGCNDGKISIFDLKIEKNKSIYNCHNSDITDLLSIDDIIKSSVLV